MTRIVDPTDERVPLSRALASRPQYLTGVVALLDIAKPRGDVLLDRLEQRLAERVPELDAQALPQTDLRQAGARRFAPQDCRGERLRYRSARRLRVMYNVQCARLGMV